MAIATFNRKTIEAAAGKPYLLASPASLVGATLADKVKELFASFYADGDIRNALKGGVTPWAVLEKTGFKAKLQAKEIKVDPNDGPEEVIGYEAISYESEMTILDCDVQHTKDMLSASAAQVLSLVASATQAGRETLLGGGQRVPTDYMFLYRYPSRQIPGEFKNVLIPCCNLVLDTDAEYSKAKARELKIKIVAKDSGLLVDPTTGMGVLWLEDHVTTAKS